MDTPPDTSPATPSREIRFELRFTGLFDRGRGYTFPCDALGVVRIEALSDQARFNYAYARAVVGRELSSPVVAKID